ncbi:ATP-binding cassette domain-containing protein [Microbacterium sp. bgisy189]|uniref:ATP-binding cassette domain-containing protein n=1 Tax=Microbacterium sp. bgisy189 TaxID=3413798 RepID=UPI003EC0E9B0
MSSPCHDVTKQFTSGSAPALQAVNLDILTGARIAILGPCGSGKSTTLRVIAGLEAVFSFAPGAPSVVPS